jgi:anti-anti-sigma regulatory factor
MKMQVVTAGPGWRSINVEHQLDRTAAPMVCDALIHAAAGEESNLLIDLEAVDAADGQGIAALIAAVRRVRVEHPSVRVAVLAHRALLADAFERKLPVADVFRSRREAHAAIAARAAA